MPEDNNLEEKFKTTGRKFKTLDKKRGGLADSKSQEKTAADQGIDRSQEKEQRQAADSSSFGQPLRQRYGENDSEFRARQQKHDQMMEQQAQAQAQKAREAREKSLTGRAEKKIGETTSKVDKWAGKQLEKGANFAKGKAGEVLRSNPRAAEAINRAQQAKQEFEERMLKFKEDIKSEPIKQRPGESDLAFRKRQQKEDDENPDNVKNRSVRNIVKERLKTGANKQTREAAEEIRKRREEINKMVKEKTEKISKRLTALKKRYSAVKMAKEKIKQEAERVAMEIAKAVAKAVAQAIWSAIGAIVAALSEIIVIILIIIVVIVIIYYMCNDGGLAGAACSAVSSLGGLVF